MQHLILMRHAKAAPEAGYANDRERPLQARGIEDARLIGRQIAGLTGLIKPAQALQVLLSPALRTRETWREVAPAFPGADALVIDALYMASAEVLWAAAQSTSCEICLMIAHNPGLHHLVQILLTQAHDHSAPARALMQAFPTSAFAAFSITGEILEAAGPHLLATNLG